MQPNDTGAGTRTVTCQKSEPEPGTVNNSNGSATMAKSMPIGTFCKFFASDISY